MARECKICAHPDRLAIEKLVVDGASNRRISTQYGFSEGAVRRHVSAHLARDLAENARLVVEPSESTHPPQSTQPIDALPIARYADERRALDAAHAVDIFAQLFTQLDHLGKIYDAVHEWLADPEDPTRYSIDPRSEEMRIVYDDLADCNEKGTPRRKRATLAALLRRVYGDSDGVIRPVMGEARYADPRDMLVKVSAELRAQMGLRVQILEKLHNAEQITLFKETVLAAIAEEAPDVRRRIEDGLRRRSPLQGISG